MRLWGTAICSYVLRLSLLLLFLRLDSLWESLCFLLCFLLWLYIFLLLPSFTGCLFVRISDLLSLSLSSLNFLLLPLHFSLLRLLSLILQEPLVFLRILVPPSKKVCPMINHFGSVFVAFLISDFSRRRFHLSSHKGSELAAISMCGISVRWRHSL